MFTIIDTIIEKFIQCFATKRQAPINKTRVVMARHPTYGECSLIGDYKDCSYALKMVKEYNVSRRLMQDPWYAYIATLRHPPPPVGGWRRRIGSQ